MIAGCSADKLEADYPVDPEDRRRLRHGKLTGEGGLTLFDGNKGSKRRSGGSAAPSIGVNSALWRATLDTISFIPLASADPFGGVIITDWYEDAQAPGERFKLNILILGTKLKADALRVSVFKQEKDENNEWRDSNVDTSMNRKLEDKILTRARHLRISQAAQD